ncbi:hypothetical protein EmuJ_000830700 [Echinococcus multilocularis]|uniref:Uncharacterized protein n=1 Tax=Echinococcus multilocularis TaxID=6211 RepID=A0A068Y851_ECHMU|nr:hypothetical protein EmuJ_000830700 [Echinococcus multilocularis]
MFRRRRKWSPAEGVLINDHANQHQHNRRLRSYLKHHPCNTSSDRSSSKQPNWAPSPTPSQPVIHYSWSIYGGHFVLWFCLLLLQQPHRGIGSLVTRDSVHSLPTKNASFSTVNTLLLQNSPPLNARLEGKRSAQSISSKYAFGMQSDQNIPHSSRRVENSELSSSSSTTSSSIASFTLLGTSPHEFVRIRSTAFSPHSTSVQTNGGQAFLTGMTTTTTAAATRLPRKKALKQWPQRPSTNAPNSSPDGQFLSAQDILRLPSPRQVQIFVDYINPYIKQSIHPQQIYFIINQWHSFRQTLRQNRRMQRFQAAEREDARRRKQSERQDSKKVDLFAKVVLRREAQALRKATSFAEFKRILLRANIKSSKSKRNSISSENGVDLSEASGGVVFHLPITPSSEEPLISQRLLEGGKRHISKRSLDEIELGKEEELKEPHTSSQKNEYSLPNGNVTEDAYAEDETENHSDEELREAYNSYNDFLSSACTPRNRTLCTKSLFPRDRVDRSTLFLPPGIYVRRCDNSVWSPTCGGGSAVNSYQAMFNQAARLRSRMALKSLCAAADRMDASARPRVTDLRHFDISGSCNCFLPEEVCLPTEVRLKIAPVVVYNTAKGTTTTEIVALTEHIKCRCQRRCENRKCISPLQLNIYTYDDCYCACAESDERCEALLDGRARFTDEELPIPLNGSYILPPCYHGPMDEVHLYHKHCPRPDGRMGDFSSTLDDVRRQNSLLCEKAFISSTALFLLILLFGDVSMPQRPFFSIITMTKMGEPTYVHANYRRFVMLGHFQSQRNSSLWPLLSK